MTKTVTVYDHTTKLIATQVIPDHDYFLVTTGDCHVDDRQGYPRTGAEVLTLKGVHPETPPVGVQMTTPMPEAAAADPPVFYDVAADNPEGFLVTVSLNGRDETLTWEVYPDEAVVFVMAPCLGAETTIDLLHETASVRLNGCLPAVVNIPDGNPQGATMTTLVHQTGERTVSQIYPGGWATVAAAPARGTQTILDHTTQTTQILFAGVRTVCVQTVPAGDA